MSTSSQETTFTHLQLDREKGLQLLYERYGKRLYGYAITSWQLSEDEAWELVYETLLKIVSSAKQYEFESEKKFGSFIFTIFCNLLRRYYRDETRRAERISFLSFDEALFDEAKDSPVLHAEREVQTKLVEQFVHTYWNESNRVQVDANLACLQAALDELEDWERVLLLQRAQDVSYSEIAHFIDKPVEQLKVYHQRARKKLMRHFTDALKTIKQRTASDENQ